MFNSIRRSACYLPAATLAAFHLTNLGYLAYNELRKNNQQRDNNQEASTTEKKDEYRMIFQHK